MLVRARAKAHAKRFVKQIVKGYVNRPAKLVV